MHVQCMYGAVRVCPEDMLKFPRVKYGAWEKAWWTKDFEKLSERTLNHRVPGSSPGAPTTAIAGVSCNFTLDRMNRFVVRFVRFVRHPYTALSFLMADSASSSRPPR
jgi:hypothetical protein